VFLITFDAANLLKRLIEGAGELFGSTRKLRRHRAIHRRYIDRSWQKRVRVYARPGVLESDDAGELNDRGFAGRIVIAREERLPLSGDWGYD
jgi:hypothetical protein